MNKYSANLLLLSTLLSLLCGIQFAIAQEEINTSSSAPKITCPQMNVINICAPVGSPAHKPFEDFNATDDNTPTTEIEFAIQENVEALADVNIITHQYSFTDKDGNSSYCEMVYNIANRFLEAPVFNNQNRICRDDFFRGLKLGKANYMIYSCLLYTSPSPRDS